MARPGRMPLVGGVLVVLVAVGYLALTLPGALRNGRNAGESEPRTATAAGPGVTAADPAQTQLAAAVPAPSEGVSAAISGEATVVESAIIEIDGKRIMLFGLEAMHPPQRCTIEQVAWPCWEETITYLTAMLAEGPVTCTPVEPPDFLRRELALCEINGESLNARYVRSGFALALADEMPEYESLEAAAREEGVGLWRLQFQRPTDWRRDQGMDVRRP